MPAWGGGVFSADDVTIENATFEDNSAVEQGGAVFSGGKLTLMNSGLFGNATTGFHGEGGAVYSAGNGTLRNSLFSGNRSSANGGAVHNAGGELVVVNVTLSGNTAEAGGGIYNAANASLVLLNSIVALNEAGGTPQDIHGAWTGSSNIVGIAPQFLRGPSPGADGVWGTPDDDRGDLHLDEVSLAIDLGENSAVTTAFDCDGHTRISNGNVDIGAYEHQGPPSTLRETPSSVVDSPARHRRLR